MSLNEDSSLRVKPIPQKRFYYLLKELDYSTYKAYDRYKATLKTSEKTIKYLRETLSPVAPFGGKSKRFNCKPQINTSNDCLNGTLKQYHANAMSRICNWRSLIEKSSVPSSKKRIGSSIAFNVKISNDMNGKRTISPSLDLFSSKEDMSRYNKHISLKRSSTVGNLPALINRSPLAKTIRTRNAITKDSGLFTTEYNTVNPVYNHKTFVNLDEMKQRGNYAGIIANKREENHLRREKITVVGSRNLIHNQISIARERKIMTYQSDIFNTKSNKYEYEYNDSQKKKSNQ